MNEASTTPKNVPELIDLLLKTKDPAVVGLRRILKKKSDEGQDFPLKELPLEQFDRHAGSSRTIFTDAEKRVLVLEKTVLELNQKLLQQKKSAEKAIQDAYKKGLGEGIKRGEKAGHDKAETLYTQRINAIEEKLYGIFKNIETSRHALFTEASGKILELSSLIARKVIDTELTLNADIILSVIKRALTFIADRQEFVVRVSPDDMEMVTQKKDFWASISERLDKISIEPDPRISKGGCIIESNTGVADARIEVQFNELAGVIESTWESMMSTGAGIGRDKNDTGQNAPSPSPENTVNPSPGVGESG